LVRSLLDGADKPDRPGLYLCDVPESNLIATLPTLLRSQTRLNDLDPRGAKHAADATMYGITGPRKHVLRQFGGYGGRNQPRYSKRQKQIDDEEGLFV